MKAKAFLFLIAAAMLVFVGCSNICDDNPNEPQNPTGTSILMLIVDYTTNEFVGGKELHFDKKSPTFTITSEYQSPGDFGWIKLYYSEIDELIFHGHIVWKGCGAIEFPTEILKAEKFKKVFTKDLRYPKNFEPVFPVDTFGIKEYPNSTIEKAWLSIQRLVKTREYLLSAEKVKVYEWQPSVGCGDIADRKWIFFLNK